MTGAIKIVISAVATLLAVGCSNKNHNQTVDHTNDILNKPQQFPQATANWNEARTFMMKQNGDNPQVCDQVDFRVNAHSGIFSVNECEHSKTGQLTADEFKRLNNLVAKAYEQTTSMICPEVFKFDQYYASIDSTNDDFDRNFDPDSSCYRGSETVVAKYKQYLQLLLTKYQTSTSSQ